MANQNRNSDAEFVIDDHEELSQKSRIRELLQRRKEVLDARNRSKDEELLGSVGHMNAIAHYQTHLETLILDLWTKFGHEPDDDAETDGGLSKGQQYLKETHITTVTVPPPPEAPTGNDLAPGAGAPEPKQEKIEGLQWFVKNDPVVTKSFTVRSFNPPGERTYTNSIPLPRSALDEAVALCFEFMNEMGVDADLNQTEQTTKIDRELLEEVDEWRQNNLN